MQRNERTFLKCLVPGDRFRFLSDVQQIVYQLTNQDISTAYGHRRRPKYNIIENGRKQWPFDKDALADKEVVFLRTGEPLPAS